jgi:hypothetical protein
MSSESCLVLLIGSFFYGGEGSVSKALIVVRRRYRSNLGAFTFSIGAAEVGPASYLVALEVDRNIIHIFSRLVVGLENGW